MKWYLLAVAGLHALFMVCELFPWRFPILLGIVSRKLPAVHPRPDLAGHDASPMRAWTLEQQPMVATIVRNAGIYNAILAGGLFWAALQPDPHRDVARVLLAGAVVAGVFGTATLRSPLTALQAFAGLIGLAFI
jgi:uncharacterized membrane protein